MQSEAEAYTAGVAARDADGTRPTRSRRAVPESDGLAASRRVPSADRYAREEREEAREVRTPNRWPENDYARRRRTSSRAEEPRCVTPSQQETRRREIAAPSFALDRRPAEEYARRRGTAYGAEEPWRARADLALTFPCETLVTYSVRALGLLMLVNLLGFIYLCIWD